ncbi:Crp/Fnr family transcriptional regulator [Bosea lathyri]|uniref:cAMP-binding domain of CRP or a regulatory subunit of cAMP-dependent protein kinases n=1 Tax=Bosea lathyri TaxID=1036778 RepID=A0A1H6D7G9_9HYPH|nr:Crp/Fnr family transcriptional regulator [Bosea lathyri]SEG81014.1 cAMP-binding domain of CRP or a regulatory subunit of cAMP-dependent protein kinases [Bosea lathyri]
MQSGPHRIVQLLSANPFFAGLAQDALAKIAGICREHHLAAREVLFLKGDVSNGLYAIRRGQIRIGTTDDSGQQMTMNLLGGGDVFGEIALLDGRSRTADAVAMEDTDMFFLPRHDFLKLLGSEPSIALQLIELLCARLRDVIDRMEEKVFLPAETRLARRILMLATDYGAEVHTSQEELASLTGVTRETVNRQLQCWKRVGFLSLGRGRLLIHDLDDFRRLAKIGTM